MSESAARSPYAPAPLSMSQRMLVREALGDCADYFDGRSDAEYFTDSPHPVPNEEMRLLVAVQAALACFEEEPS